jgi:hypothetical protein
MFSLPKGEGGRHKKGQKTRFDVYLAHDLAMDLQGRNNFDRMAEVNAKLRQLGYETWFEQSAHLSSYKDMCNIIGEISCDIAALKHAH